MKSDRRAFLASLASSAALAACSGGKMLPQFTGEGGEPSFVVGPHGNTVETIPLTIVNKTGAIADKDVFFFLYGQGVAPDDNWYHVVDPSGKFVQCNSTNDKYAADYNFSLANVKQLKIPTMRSARLYFSFNKKVLIKVNDVRIPTPPSGIEPAPQNPNYPIRWDFIEWTYNPAFPKNSGWNGNITNVDAMNIPMQFAIGGQNDNYEPVLWRRGCLGHGFSKILAGLRANGKWRNLILPGSNRILAPDRGIEKGIFPANYYDAYVNAVWKKYSSSAITVQANVFGTWQGKVQRGNMVFTQVQGSPKLAPVVLRKPTSLELIANSNICISGCGAGGNQQEDINNQIRAAFLAALNRSTLLTDPTLGIAYNSAYCKNTKAFYQDPTTNLYAKLIHQNAVAGRAYAFGFDDSCGQSSFEAVRIPKNLTVTLMPD